MAGPPRRVAGRRRSGDEPEPTSSSATTPPIVPARRRPSPLVRRAETPEPVESVDLSKPEPTVDEALVDEALLEEATVEPGPEPEHHPSPGPLIAVPPNSKPASPLLVPLAVAAVALVALIASVLWLVHLDGRAPLKAPKAAATATRQPAISDSGVYTPGAITSVAGAQAVQAAVTALPVVLSYDYRSLAKGIANAKVYLTPGYAKIFEQTYSTTVSKFATANKTVTKALVRSAGLVNADGDSATVLVFLDEALVPGDGTQPKINLDRVKLTMLRASNGKWLIDALQPF